VKVPEIKANQFALVLITPPSDCAPVQKLQKLQKLKITKIKTKNK
jgi:hypothetical protein